MRAKYDLLIVCFGLCCLSQLLESHAGYIEVIWENYPAPYISSLYVNSSGEYAYRTKYDDTKVERNNIARILNMAGSNSAYSIKIKANIDTYVADNIEHVSYERSLSQLVEYYRNNSNIIVAKPGDINIEDGWKIQIIFYDDVEIYSVIFRDNPDIHCARMLSIIQVIGSVFAEYLSTPLSWAVHGVEIFPERE